MLRHATVVLGTLLLLAACAPEAPPVEDAEIAATPDEPYVSPYTNTPLGGSHVRQRQGRPIGAITTVGDVAVLELDEGVMSEANLFDLDGRTLRFTPEGSGFRAESLPLEWVSERGEQLEGTELNLTAFAFPFSGTTWDSIVVHNMGLITFGGGYDEFGLGRYVHYELVGSQIVNTIPTIAPFMKHRMRGDRHVNEMADRVVITWDLTEPFNGLQDMTFVPTPHHFQAVLYASGQIDLSYQEMTARDAVVGVYTVPEGGAPETEAIDFSTIGAAAGPAPVIFEGFHHYGLPGSENLACTVIEALGDRFDFMIWYSDFRVDDQEAGTRSVGDIPQNVEGIGPRMDIGLRSSDYCSEGRLQVTWYQPVYVNAVQAHERSPDGRWSNYDLAMAQIGHELGHRWSTRSRAIVEGETIELRGEHVPWAMSGAAHWPAGLHAPSPFPYGDGPHEGSVMGGAVYQDNGDGTFTVLDRGSMVPASGYSYLELYLIGVLAPEEVPDFFLLTNIERAGRDDQGRQVVRADKIDITIEDIIAHNGPRVPSFEDAPKEFSTAFVAVVLPGRTPSPELLERTDGIRRQWMSYWAKVTGGVATMSTRLGGR
jgi:hypothetical protein